MNRRAVFAAGVVIALALAAGCSSRAAVSVTGTWESIGGGTPRLEVHSSGAASGDDGCNGIGGRWKEVQPGFIEFDETVMSLMACPGVPDQWLGLMRSASVDGNKLTVRDGDGVVLGELYRR